MGFLSFANAKDGDLYGSILRQRTRFSLSECWNQKKKEDLDQFSIKAKLISDEHLIRSLHFLCR